MKRPCVIALALIFALSLFTVQAFAEEGEQQQEASDAVVNEIPVGFAGMQIFIDADTGLMRPPSASEAEQLKAAMIKMFGHRKASTEVVPHKNGMLSAVVGTEFLNFSIVTYKNGEISTTCTDSPDAAAAFVEAAGQPATE